MAPQMDCVCVQLERTPKHHPHNKNFNCQSVKEALDQLTDNGWKVRAAFSDRRVAYLIVEKEE